MDGDLVGKLLEPNNSKPLSQLVSIVSRKCYEEFAKLQSQPKEGANQKKKVFEHCHRVRQRLLRLHALVLWSEPSQGQESVTSACVTRATALNEAQSVLSQAQHVVETTRLNLGLTMSPVFDVSTAVDVLTAGSYLRFPRVVTDRAPEPLVITPDQELPALFTRLASTFLAHSMPPLRCPEAPDSVDVADGVVVLAKTGLYRIELTLAPAPFFSLLLSNLPPRATVAAVEKLLAEKAGAQGAQGAQGAAAAKPKVVRVYTDAHTRMRCAVVRFAKHELAAHARQTLAGCEVQGARLRAEFNSQPHLVWFPVSVQIHPRTSASGAVKFNTNDITRRVAAMLAETPLCVAQPPPSASPLGTACELVFHAAMQTAFRMLGSAAQRSLAPARSQARVVEKTDAAVVVRYWHEGEHGDGNAEAPAGASELTLRQHPTSALISIAHSPALSHPHTNAPLVLSAQQGEAGLFVTPTELLGTVMGVHAWHRLCALRERVLECAELHAKPNDVVLAKYHDAVAVQLLRVALCKGREVCVRVHSSSGRFVFVLDSESPDVTPELAAEQLSAARVVEHIVVLKKSAVLAALRGRLHRLGLRTTDRLQSGDDDNGDCEHDTRVYADLGAGHVLRVHLKPDFSTLFFLVALGSPQPSPPQHPQPPSRCVARAIPEFELWAVSAAAEQGDDRPAKRARLAQEPASEDMSARLCRAVEWCRLQVTRKSVITTLQHQQIPFSSPSPTTLLLHPTLEPLPCSAPRLSLPSTLRSSLVLSLSLTLPQSPLWRVQGNGSEKGAWRDQRTGLLWEWEGGEVRAVWEDVDRGEGVQVVLGAFTSLRKLWPIIEQATQPQPGNAAQVHHIVPCSVCFSLPPPPAGREGLGAPGAVAGAARCAVEIIGDGDVRFGHGPQPWYQPFMRAELEQRGIAGVSSALSQAHALAAAVQNAVHGLKHTLAVPTSLTAFAVIFSVSNARYVVVVSAGGSGLNLSLARGLPPPLVALPWVPQANAHAAAPDALAAALASSHCLALCLSALDACRASLPSHELTSHTASRAPSMNGEEDGSGGARGAAGVFPAQTLTATLPNARQLTVALVAPSSQLGKASLRVDVACDNPKERQTLGWMLSQWAMRPHTTSPVHHHPFANGTASAGGGGVQEERGWEEGGLVSLVRLLLLDAQFLLPFLALWAELCPNVGVVANQRVQERGGLRGRVWMPLEGDEGPEVVVGQHGVTFALTLDTEGAHTRHRLTVRNDGPQLYTVLDEGNNALLQGGESVLVDVTTNLLAHAHQQL